MAAINELDALCVALPVDLCPMSSADHLFYLALVHVEGVGWCPVGHRLAFHPAWLLMRTVCAERAIDAVDGARVVQGQVLTPEAYIGVWRTRLANATSMPSLAEVAGLQVLAVFDWEHTAALAVRKPSWVRPPAESFGELLRLHGIAPLSLGEAPRPARLQIDLARPNGARDAWWVDDFLSSARQHENPPVRRLEIRALDRRDAGDTSGPLPARPDAARSTHAIAHF